MMEAKKLDPFHFTGNETVGQVFDQLMMNSSGVHRDVVAVSTISGVFRGKILSKGNHFIVMELETNWSTMGEKSQKIIAQQLIAMNSITGIHFEILR